MMLMVAHVHASHDGARSSKKLTRNELEEIAAMAAFVQNLKHEVQSVMPIPDAVIEESWLSKFAAADPQITTQVRQHVLTPKLPR